MEGSRVMYNHRCQIHPRPEVGKRERESRRTNESEKRARERECEEIEWDKSEERRREEVRVPAKGTETRRAVYISPFSSRGWRKLCDRQLNALQLTCVSPTCSPTQPGRDNSSSPALYVPSPALFPSPFPPDSLSFLPASVSHARAKSDRISSTQLEVRGRGGGREFSRRYIDEIDETERKANVLDSIGQKSSANFLRTRQLHVSA